MYFEVYGPFTVPRANRKVKKEGLAAFWRAAEKTDEGLSSAIGAYIFSLTNGERRKPFYVGMTCNQLGFQRECFERHKIDHYDTVMAGSKGVPEMHLVAALTDSARFSRGFASAKTEICFVERTLIGMALRQNPDLCNVRDTKYLKSCTVRGIMGEATPGRHPQGARTLRSAFGLA